MRFRRKPKTLPPSPLDRIEYAVKYPDGNFALTRDLNDARRLAATSNRYAKRGAMTSGLFAGAEVVTRFVSEWETAA